MMMIAFITIKNSLVPLIEGLCAQILQYGKHILKTRVWEANEDQR